MKKSFQRRAQRLMAMSPLVLLCMAPGLQAQELDLSQDEVTIDRVIVDREEVIVDGEDVISDRAPVEPMSTIEAAKVALEESKPEANEFLIAPTPEPQERDAVETINELPTQEVVLREPVIEAPLITAQMIEDVESTQAQVVPTEEDVFSDLELENQGLENQVCEQRQKISTLEEEIAAIKNQATDYMPLLSTMNQLMMMNMNMMMMNQNQLSFQTSPLDMMGSMMAPMMMMQSMSMGMSIASMNNLYHQPATPKQPQYNYNIGGDFYGRDYSMTQETQQPVQAPYATPYGFDFGGRSPSFSQITPAERPSEAPTQTQGPPAIQIEEGLVN